MFDRLLKLKNDMGYSPDMILDIGAHHGEWTNSMKQIYTAQPYYLFEGIDYSELKQFENSTNIKVFNIILNDKNEEVNWYQMKNTGDSIFKEKSHHFANCPAIKRDAYTLDSFVLQDSFLQEAKNILIKIDCQGAEIPILKGSTSILNKTDFIILEIPLFGQYNEGVPTFLEHIKFMESIGFVPYDIIDNHYINNFNMQVDMLFINKTHKLNIMVHEALL